MAHDRVSDVLRVCQEALAREGAARAAYLDSACGAATRLPRLQTAQRDTRGARAQRRRSADMEAAAPPLARVVVANVREPTKAGAASGPDQRSL
jgi:hypothetical protein